MVASSSVFGAATFLSLISPVFCEVSPIQRWYDSVIWTSQRLNTDSDGPIDGSKHR